MNTSVLEDWEPLVTNWEPLGGGFGHEFTKNGVVPALLFFIPLGATWGGFGQKWGHEDHCVQEITYITYRLFVLLSFRQDSH